MFDSGKRYMNEFGATGKDAEDQSVCRGNVVAAKYQPTDIKRLRTNKVLGFSQIQNKSDIKCLNYHSFKAHGHVYLFCIFSFVSLRLVM